MRYHLIKTDDMLNGTGLRVTLFVSGCSHACAGCHNPETWNCKSGIEYDNVADDIIFNELEKDYISGLTISGGDPLFLGNLSNIYNLCKCIKKLCPNKTIWIYTGYTWEELQSNWIRGNDDRQLILKYCDVLVDGEFVQEFADVNYPWAGSTNQRVIDVQKSLQLNSIVLYK